LPQGAEIFVTTDSQLKYLRPGIAGLDAELLRFTDANVSEGMTVWDIGANVGVFCFGAAARGAHVLAIEPDPRMASLLLRRRGFR